MECHCEIGGRAVACGFDQGARIHQAQHRCPFIAIALRRETDALCSCCPLCTLLCLPRKTLLRLPEFRDVYAALEDRISKV